MSNVPRSALEFLAEIMPDTPEMRRAQKAERLRLELARAMRWSRLRAGLSQTQVAERLGVSQGWVSRLENCNNDHNVESLLAFADAVDATLGLSLTAGATTFDVVSGRMVDSAHALRHVSSSSQPQLSFHACSEAPGVDRASDKLIAA